MTEDQTYDAIVIGAGQAGVPLAICLAREGAMRTALIEEKHVGGTCINEGCTPTKTMVASARVAHLARRGADYGVQTGLISIDMSKVRQRKRAIVDSFRYGSRYRLERTERLDLLMGTARFAGPQTVEVHLNDGGMRRLTADRILINTGARPARPVLEGLEHVQVLDSTSVMELDVVPAHLLVLGGGYVGLEFGQMFRRFGSRVTIIQRAEQLLPQEDADVAEEITKILREDGVDVLLRAQARRVVPDGNGAGGVLLAVQMPDGERELSGSHLMAAAGRVPNTESLNLGAAGLQTDHRGFIPVNDRLETAMPGVYALGDVNGGPAFTHISYDDFRIIRTNLVRGGDARTTGRLVPYTVFIDPQLGRVGLTERQAEAQGHNIGVAKLPMRHVARALEIDESRGFIKAVVDAESDQILGCAILGVEGGELMAIVQLAIMGKIPYMVLRDTIFSHPTLAESLNNLFLKWEKEPMEIMESQAAYAARVVSEAPG